MPVGSVAPITGKLRKHFFFDVSMALGGGTIFGLAFWYVQGKKRLTTGTACTFPACSSVC